MIIYSYEILVFISSRYQEEIILLITPTTVYIIATELQSPLVQAHTEHCYL